MKPLLMQTKVGLSKRLMFVLTMILAIGCATPQKPLTLEQLQGQLQDQQKKSKLQDQLLTQIGRATLKDYQDYQIGPEDLLEVSFFGQSDLDRDARVNGRGEISMPLVGQVIVAGLSPQEVGKRLARLYKEGEYINEPQITVLVKEYRHQRVMVTGGVVNPGSYEVIGPRTLLEMLGKAGGLNDKGGDVVHIIRYQNASDLAKSWKGGEVQSFSPGTETIVIDLRRLLVKGALELNVPIKNGDVIYVPYARNAYVLGAVRKPGQIPIKDNITVTHALALSQGVDPMLASSNGTIVRLNEEDGQQVTINFNGGMHFTPVYTRYCG